MRPVTVSKVPPLAWLELLRQQVASLRYGVVQIVVHDRRVVQIERTEKFRFNGEKAQSSASNEINPPDEPAVNDQTSEN